LAKIAFAEKHRADRTTYTIPTTFAGMWPETPARGRSRPANPDWSS
jgi:hypothetical protein